MNDEFAAIIADADFRREQKTPWTDFWASVTEWFERD